MAALATLAVAGVGLGSMPAHGAPAALEPPKKAIRPIPPAAPAAPAAAPAAPAAPTAPAAAPAAPAAPTASAKATAPAGSAGLSKFDPAKLSTRDARLDALRVRVEERQKTLEARRQAEQDRVRIRWGAVVQQPTVVQALQLHAYRVARLERVQELAQVEAKPAIAARASKALDRENVRHERTMAALASGAAAPPVPAPGGGQ